MASSVARLRQCGVLEVHQGALQLSDRFLAHLSLYRHAGRVPSWDLLAVLELALSTWDDYAGDARESARAVVRFLPPTGMLPPSASFPVLDAFVAA